MHILKGCFGLHGLAISGAAGGAGAGAGFFQLGLSSVFSALGGSVSQTGVFEAVLEGANPNAVGRLLAIGALVIWLAPTSPDFAERLLKPSRPSIMVLKGFFVSFIFLVSLSHIGRISTFIYYQF